MKIGARLEGHFRRRRDALRIERETHEGVEFFSVDLEGPKRGDLGYVALVLEQLF